MINSEEQLKQKVAAMVASMSAEQLGSKFIQAIEQLAELKKEAFLLVDIFSLVYQLDTADMRLKLDQFRESVAAMVPQFKQKFSELRERHFSELQNGTAAAEKN